MDAGGGRGLGEEQWMRSRTDYLCGKQTTSTASCLQQLVQSTSIIPRIYRSYVYTWLGPLRTRGDARATDLNYYRLVEGA